MRKDDYLNMGSGYGGYKKELTGEELENIRKKYSQKYNNTDEWRFYINCYDIPIYDESGFNLIDIMTLSIHKMEFIFIQ